MQRLLLVLPLLLFGSLAYGQTRIYFGAQGHLGYTAINIPEVHSYLQPVLTHNKLNYGTAWLGGFQADEWLLEATLNFGRFHTVSGIWTVDGRTLSRNYGYVRLGGHAGYRKGPLAIKSGLEMGADTQSDYILLSVPLILEYFVLSHRHLEVPVYTRLDYNLWGTTYFSFVVGTGLRFGINLD